MRKVLEVRAILSEALIEVYEVFKNNHESIAFTTSNPREACELLCELDFDVEISPVDKVSLILYV